MRAGCAAHSRWPRNVALALVLWCGFHGALRAEEVSPAIANAIRATWATVDASWNGRDAEHFSLCFTADGQFTNVAEGRTLEDQTQIRRFFEETFPKIGAGIRHLTRVTAFRPIAPGLVAADGEVEISREAPDDAGQRKVLRRFAILALMKEESDGWKVQLLRAYKAPEPAGS